MVYFVKWLWCPLPSPLSPPCLPVGQPGDVTCDKLPTHCLRKHRFVCVAGPDHSNLVVPDEVCQELQQPPETSQVACSTCDSVEEDFTKGSGTPAGGSKRGTSAASGRRASGSTAFLLGTLSSLCAAGLLLA